MLSMTLATLGWGTWWTVLILRRLAPGWEVSLAVPGAVATTFAVLGFAAAVLTVRAGRSWMLFAMVPLFANASLLCMPWLAGGMWPDE